MQLKSWWEVTKYGSRDKYLVNTSTMVAYQVIPV